jgi:hypothetical protein
MWSAARSAIATIVDVGLTPGRGHEARAVDDVEVRDIVAPVPAVDDGGLWVVAHPSRPQEVPAGVAHQPVDLDLERARRVHRVLRALDVEVEHPARVVGHPVVDLRRRESPTSRSRSRRS